MVARFKPISIAAIALGVMLASAVAMFSLRLLIVGVPLTVVPEVPTGAQESSRVASVEYAPYPAAVVPLAATVLLVGGLLTRKLWVAWTGWVILCVFSGLFLFSSGAALLPAASMLLVLLAIIRYGRRYPNNPMRISSNEST